jgi:cyclophilin family peptidyl-prolyl cis-trans isomerase
MTVNNFLSYQSQYENSILHRSATTLTGDPFVIQGGGFRIDNGSVKRIVTEAPVPNQFNANNSNIRGTVAMALPQGNPDGGTSQWFINLADGNEVLDDSLYTVFGRVIGTGMDVVDALHGIPKSNIVVPASDDALFEVPLTDFEEFTIPITGTVSALSAETKLTGNGTRFLSELAPRGEIKIGNQQYVIRSINSDLELELQVGPVSNISGATALVNALPDIEDYVVFRSVQVVFPQDST